MQQPLSDQARSAFHPLAFGLAAAIVWLPSARIEAAVHIVGYTVAFMALGKLADVKPRFGGARWWLVAAAAVSLITLIGGHWIVFYRTGFEVRLPDSMRLEDYFMGGAVWLVAGGLIDLANGTRNIALRDTVAARRDFYLLFLAAEGLLIGPVAALLYARIIGVGFYQVVFWGVVLLRLAAMAGLFGLCARVAKQGIEAEEQVL
jgi:hypothetical protein